MAGAPVREGDTETDCVSQRRMSCEGADAWREDGHVTTEADTRVMQLLAKQHQGLLITIRG